MHQINKISVFENKKHLNHVLNYILKYNLSRITTQKTETCKLFQYFQLYYREEQNVYIILKYV